jgi:hypothetical protein
MGRDWSSAGREKGGEGISLMNGEMEESHQFAKFVDSMPGTVFSNLFTCRTEENGRHMNGQPIRL